MADSVSLGYAVAYPLGVVGIIMTIIIMRYVLRIDFKKEDEGLATMSNGLSYPTATRLSSLTDARWQDHRYGTYAYQPPVCGIATYAPIG